MFIHCAHVIDKGDAANKGVGDVLWIAGNGDGFHTGLHFPWVDSSERLSQFFAYNADADLLSRGEHIDAA